MEMIVIEDGICDYCNAFYDIIRFENEKESVICLCSSCLAKAIIKIQGGEF